MDIPDPFPIGMRVDDPPGLSLPPWPYTCVVCGGRRSLGRIVVAEGVIDREVYPCECEPISLALT